MGIIDTLSSEASAAVQSATAQASSALNGLTSSVQAAATSAAQNASSALTNAANSFGFTTAGSIPDVTLPTITVTGSTPTATINTYKVAIQGPTGTVIFESTVPFAEERSASYQGYDLVHLPVEIPAYKNTTSRQFNVSGKFISRTPAEATANAAYLDMVRAWVLPDYANTGATPPILKLYAYKNNHLTGVQCILKNYSFFYPDDVDYIFTGSVPMPVIANISLTLTEIFSPEQITAQAWLIKPPTMQRPPDAFGSGDSSFGATSGGLNLGGITLSQVIPVATALVGAAKGNSSALSSLEGYALGTASSLIGSNPAVKSFVSSASSVVNSAVTTAESTVQGALNSAVSSVVGYTQSIGSSSVNAASQTGTTAGSGGLFSSTGNSTTATGNSTASYTTDSVTTSI